MPGPGSNPATEEQQFVNAIVAQTGLDPRVVEAWVTAEGAYAANGTGGHNWLNLRHYGTDVGVSGQSSGGFDQFDSVGDAITSTVRRIHQPFLWAYLGPVIAAHGTPAAQISAIGTSGWDAGHYGSPPGSALLRDFPGGSSAAGGPATTTPAGPGGAQPGSGGGGLGGIVTDIPVIGPVIGAVDSVGTFLKYIASVRFVELLGGIALVAIGLFILARALLQTAPVKIAGATVGNFTQASAASSSQGSLETAPRRVQRRVGFESNTPSRRSQGQERRAAVRRAAARAEPSEEIPF
jgi:hypothetical protein